MQHSLIIVIYYFPVSQRELRTRQGCAANLLIRGLQHQTIFSLIVLVFESRYGKDEYSLWMCMYIDIMIVYIV
jgi:hypothetical protein